MDKQKGSKEVKNNVKVIYLSLEELHPFQGDLKGLTEENFKKLKRQLLQNGFICNFVVWKDPKDNLYKVLDGHQRLRVLSVLQTEGFELPEEYPCSEVVGLTFKEAKECVLALCSQYGSMSNDTLYEYLFENEIDPVKVFEDYSIDAISDNNFLAEFGDTEPSEKERCETCGHVLKTKKSKES